MMSSLRRSAWGMILACVLTWPAAARAQSAHDKQRATQLLRAGAGLLEKKDYGQALERFTEAYDLVASPKIQFNIGLAQEGLGHPGAAVRAYRLYLQDATTDAPERRAEAQDRSKALRARVTFVRITSDVSGATVIVDGAEQGTTPLAQPLIVEAGVHGLVIQAPGRPTPWTRNMRAEGGGSIDLEANLGPRPAPAVLAPAPVAALAPKPAPAPPAVLVTASADAHPAPSGTSPWVWGSVGVGLAVAATVAVYFLVPPTSDRSCPAGETCLHAR